MAGRARALCCGSQCYKAHHLRLMGKSGAKDNRRLLAELSACQAGLTREDLVRATMRLSASNSISLAWQCLTEMGRRNMRASIAAHNALMEAYGRLRRWDLSMRLLLRMQQLGLQPNERSYTAAIHASVGSPGSSKLAETLRPQLEAAARRSAARLSPGHRAPVAADEGRAPAHVRGATPARAPGPRPQASGLGSQAPYGVVQAR